MKPVKRKTDSSGFRRSSASRGQAAIFDGITLLLMVGFSCALVYSVVTSYGESMDTALYSFYELNYLQSAVKSLYYINLQSVSNVTADATDRDTPLSNAYLVSPALSGGTDNNQPLLLPGSGCAQFASFTGSVTALDLLKKDLSDDPTNPQPTPPALQPVLDDKFWSTDPNKGVSAPGRQAVRCALKEIMKPLVISGYDYYAEVVNPSYSTVPNHAIEFGAGTARITSNGAAAVKLSP